ncbi:BTB/POZ domain-containing protein [Thalictrum thalictroides]|uniref:BTB/POZ domain-containing protein n=1 Tax=Thalictrum thalictroides TaxID=46969 RepID=A0A7J6USV6_THATH|nr:BTB/POZ domain-containing protein [Thalictrum thalictroides]
MFGNNRKRYRHGSSPHLSTFANIETCRTDGTLTEITQKTPLGCGVGGGVFSNKHPLSSPPPTSSSTPSVTVFSFNDPSTADVILRLYLDSSIPDPDSDDPDSISSADSANQADVKLYLHSDVLRRSLYFSALLSDRWQKRQLEDEEEKIVFNHVLKVPASIGSIDSHLTVLQLLYTDDFSGTVDSASSALSILPVALELLFEDCVRACVRFLEVVPWNEEEENRVLSIIPLLTEEESRELVARVLPCESDLSEEMLYSLIFSAIHNNQNVAPKAFVSKLLRDFSSRDSAKRVLDRAFEMSLNLVKESMEAYSSPDFRGEYFETEAIQRVNLHKAMTNGKQLLWLIERMIELRVADTAVKEWSDQASFTANLQWAFRDDAWRNNVPGLPGVVLRCTCKLATAVSTGSILASRQVRMKLIKDWLPVLIVCRGKMMATLPSDQVLYQELEETFLKIISTLPMSDAQELLPQCLNFSTRNVEDCPHLVSAFNTWFRRAARTPLNNNLS